LKTLNNKLKKRAFLDIYKISLFYYLLICV